MDWFSALGIGMFRAREVVIPTKTVEVFKADDLSMTQAADLAAPTPKVEPSKAEPPAVEQPQKPAGDTLVPRKTTPTTLLLDPTVPATPPADTGEADKALDSLEKAMSTYRTDDGAGLTPQQSQVMRDVLSVASVGASPEQRAVLAQDMERALGKDQFTETDAYGKSTLDYLKEYTQSPLNPGLGASSKGAVARDIVHLLAHPEATTQGQDTMDCAPATFQATVAHKQPADFARIAVGLATKGEAIIPGVAGGPRPDKLVLPPYDASKQAGRDPVSFAMQGALARYAGAGDLNDGLTAAQVERMYEGVTNQGFVSFTPETLLVNLISVLQNPTFMANLMANHDDKFDMGKVTMDNGGVLHSLAVERIKLDGAYLFDPNTGVRSVMEIGEFLQKAVRVTVPERWFGDDGADQANAVFDQKEGGGRVGRAGRLG